MVSEKHRNDHVIYRNYQKLVLDLLTVGGYDWQAAAVGLQMCHSSLQIITPTDVSIFNCLTFGNSVMSTRCNRGDMKKACLFVCLRHRVGITMEDPGK